MEEKCLRMLDGQPLRRRSKWAVALCQAHYGMFRVRIKGRDREGLRWTGEEPAQKKYRGKGINRVGVGDSWLVRTQSSD